jgi:hypothetical protein
MISSSNTLRQMISKDQQNVFLLIGISGLDTDFEHDWLRYQNGYWERWKTTVSLERIGLMPMPIDLLVEYTDGTMESFIFRCARCITKRESNACGKKECFKRLEL